MPTKRPDESQDAFVIRCIRDDETAACVRAAVLAEVQVIEAGGPASPIGWAIVQALTARIAERTQG